MYERYLNYIIRPFIGRMNKYLVKLELRFAQLIAFDYTAFLHHAARLFFSAFLVASRRRRQYKSVQ